MEDIEWLERARSRRLEPGIDLCDRVYKRVIVKLYGRRSWLVFSLRLHEALLSLKEHVLES